MTVEGTPCARGRTALMGLVDKEAHQRLWKWKVCCAPEAGGPWWDWWTRRLPRRWWKARHAPEAGRPQWDWWTRRLRRRQWNKARTDHQSQPPQRHHFHRHRQRQGCQMMQQWRQLGGVCVNLTSGVLSLSPLADYQVPGAVLSVHLSAAVNKIKDVTLCHLVFWGGPKHCCIPLNLERLSNLYF
jgi:hypothetical protein